MKTNREIILDFIFKYFCILKAASHGWSVIYIGGNNFDFKYTKICKKSNFKNLMNNYSKNLM